MLNCKSSVSFYFVLSFFFTSNSERSHLIKFLYSFNNNQYLCSLFLTHSSLLSRSMNRLNFCFHHWHQSTVVLSENNVFILCHVPPHIWVSQKSSSIEVRSNSRFQRFHRNPKSLQILSRNEPTKWLCWPSLQIVLTSFLNPTKTCLVSLSGIHCSQSMC